MADITLHIEKTENLLLQVKLMLHKELLDCENELLTQEVRIAILRIDRRERKLEKIKYRMNHKMTRKDSASLKKIYKFLKTVIVESK